MWTERAEIISDFNEAISYIESQDCFHDYKLGNVQIFDSKIIILIEEDIKENAHIWDFSFFNTSELKIDMDCVMPSYIRELEINNHFVTIGLDNGYISFNAGNLFLGIPKF
ncbi:MAG: hypothetical protein ACI4JW_10605 [Oscillospiraceae bacterium]